MPTLDLNKYKKPAAGPGVPNLDKYKLNAPKEQPGIFSRIKTATEQSFGERNEKVKTGAERAKAGQQSHASGVFQAIGQVAGAAGDLAINTAKEAVRSVAPGAIPVIKNTLGAALQSKPAQAVAGKYQEFKGAHPTAAANVEAAGNIASILPLGKAPAVVAKAAGKGAQVAGDAAKAAGKVATKAVPDIKPFAKSYEADIAKQFDEEGIKAPVSAVTRSPFVQGAEAVAAKSAFGRKIVDQVKDAQTQIETRTNAVVERIKPVKTISDENLGKTIQEGLQEYEHYFKVGEEKVYADFAKRYGSKAEAEAVSTRDVLRSIVDQQGKDYFKGVDSRLSSMLDRLDGETADIQKMRKEGLPEQVIEQQRQRPVLSFDELKSTRTSVGEQLARDPDNTALKRLYGALSQDMEGAVNALEPGGQAAEALQYLNAQYKSGKQRIESRIAQSIEQSNPERIAQNIITRNSADTLRTLKLMIGTSRFDEVSKTFLRQTLDSSMTRGKFDVDKLKKSLAAYDKETLDEVLNMQQRVDLEDAIAKLEKYQRLEGALKKGAKYTEGSQTAFLQNITGTGARVAAFATAILSGNGALAAGILFGTVAEAAYTKLFTSEIGRKFLTQGFTGEEQVKSVGSYLKNVQPGLSTKSVADTKYSVTPEKVAKNIDASDLSLISELLAKHNSGNVNVFMGIREKAGAMLRGMGIDKLPEADQMRFLQEVKGLAPKKLFDGLKSEMSSPSRNGWLRDDAGRFRSPN